MTAPLPATEPQRAQGVVRRWIVYIILFTLVTLAANGLSGLLRQLIDTNRDLYSGTYDLALWLAYALIAGPLAVVLWWFSWRRMSAADRGSVAWGLYIAVMYTVSLIVFSTAALTLLADAVAGDWAPRHLATAVVWFAVWLAHRALWRHRTKGPTTLAGLPGVLGSLWGLGVAAAGAIRIITAVFEEAFATGPSIGAAWWLSPAQAAVWTAGGTIIWWWHWHREQTAAQRGGFADVVLVITVFASAAVTLGGVGTMLFVALRAVADSAAGWRDILDPLPMAIAAAAIGAIVWLFHRRAVTDRASGARSAARLGEAGIGLAGLATGVGVVLNAVLSAVNAPLAGTDARELLLGGLAALIVGAVVWVWAWRPLRTDEEAGDAGRRIYLVAIFGVSAVVALSALLVIAFRIFEVALGDGGHVIDRVRAPLGLLVATAIVAGYHFAVWRRDRALVPPVAAPARTIDQVVLVAGGDTAAVVAAIRAATGAEVVVWERADAASDASDASAAAITDALSRTTARRVLVVVGASLEVIPLAG